MRIGLVRSASREYPRVMCDGMDLSDQVPVDQKPKFAAAVPGSTFAFELFSLDARGQKYRRGKTVVRHTVEAVVDAVEFVA
jgi:hypothetical protein